MQILTPNLGKSTLMSQMVSMTSLDFHSGLEQDTLVKYESYKCINAAMSTIMIRERYAQS